MLGIHPITGPAFALNMVSVSKSGTHFAVPASLATVGRGQARRFVAFLSTSPDVIMSIIEIAMYPPIAVKTCHLDPVSGCMRNRSRTYHPWNSNRNAQGRPTKCRALVRYRQAHSSISHTK